jgi:hypothetical protein
MRPIYIFAGLAVLFVVYSENQRTAAMQTQQLQLAALNNQTAQLAIASANSPAGLINSVVGGIGTLANLSGFGLD